MLEKNNSYYDDSTDTGNFPVLASLDYFQIYGHFPKSEDFIHDWIKH